MTRAAIAVGLLVLPLSVAQQILPIYPPRERFPMREVIKENDRVTVSLDSNELTIRGKANFVDPVKIRLGSIGHTKGGVSFELQRQDGVWEEIVTLTVRQDERERSDPFKRTGELEITVRHDQPGVPDDQQFIKVALFRWDGIRLFVPIMGMGAGTGVSRHIALRSLANGRLVCAENAGQEPLIANRDVRDIWETFEVVDVP